MLHNARSHHLCGLHMVAGVASLRVSISYFVELLALGFFERDFIFASAIPPHMRIWRETKLIVRVVILTKI
jgi:hypothetical protein